MLVVATSLLPLLGTLFHLTTLAAARTHQTLACTHLTLMLPDQPTQSYTITPIGTCTPRVRISMQLERQQAAGFGNG